LSTALTPVEVRGPAGREVLRVAGNRVDYTRATLQMEPGSVPVLTLTLAVGAGLIGPFSAAKVEVSAETYAALVAMGWTPPGGERTPPRQRAGRT
jgi:hypothetical protein